MKDILVAVGRTPSSNSAVDAAAQLAKQFGARLTVLYTPPSSQISAMAIHAGGPALVEEVAQERKDHGGRAREQVSSMISPLKIELQWIEAGGDDQDALARHAFISDLVVVGRRCDQNADGLNGRDIARLITESGRPVMVIPPQYRTTDLGRRVIVGWNGSRGAARAVHDGLPILRRAESVELMIVTSVPQAGSDADVGVSIRDHLARHGVEACSRTATFQPALGVDRILVNSATAGADLLVMGAFGRPRLRQLALGSVTNSVIENATVPVLLSF